MLRHRAMPILFAMLTVIGCNGQNQTPDWCADRADDSDCDGVPTDWDQCPETVNGAPTDRLGCSEAQAAGCGVSLVEPDNKARLTAPARFRWSGDCDVWLLQMSNDPTFPAGATQTVVRTTDSEVLAEGSLDYWRVVGGKTGVSSGVESEVREVKRWR